MTSPQMPPHSILNGLTQKIEGWWNHAKAPLNIYGVSTEQWIFLSLNSLATTNKIHLWVFDSNDQAESILELVKQVAPNLELAFYPGLDANPYHSQVASEQNFLHRLVSLNKIAHFNATTPLLVLTSIEALYLKQIDHQYFDNTLTISASDIISPEELAVKLRTIGFSSSTTVEEPGTFVRKGEIFDIFPIDSGPYRLHYFDDMIEAIHPIDLKTQKTIRDVSLEQLVLIPGPGVLCQGRFATQLREKLPMPAPQFKEKFEHRKRIFSQLQDSLMFESAVQFVPYFFEFPKTLEQWLAPHQPLVTFFEARETKQALIEWHEELREDYEFHQSDLKSDSLILTPESLYDFAAFDKLSSQFHLNIDTLNISALNGFDDQQNIELALTPLLKYFAPVVNAGMKKSEAALASLRFLREEFKHSGHILFLYRHKSSLHEFERLLNYLEYPAALKQRMILQDFPLNQGFYYQHEKLLVLTESDLFSVKKAKVQKSETPRVDLFAEQLATLKPGDYVIHQVHGLGEYLGLESFDFGGVPSDYLVILYAENDKVYVPVYKLNLITKHAEQAAGLKPESLRTNRFQTIKARAKSSAKKLAFDLLKLQAERQSTQAYAFSPPDDYFHEFEQAFRFEETPDQLRAIENVLHDMQRSFPMDHLVCGDVGFGKTEVAMRAAFKAVQDDKQVAILVPTTILAFQHFNSFTERFKNFPVKIEYLSRFKSAKEVTEIKKRLELGDIDILIGTHKILSDSCRFKDLGLVIVDEEQRFGVGHKEKLKVMKASVDFLTLTATPIPRTLQLAFLGLRDLSLIQTAPPRRQSIKTYIIKEDDLTLQSALKKELARGGQAFVVHNRVNDIEDYCAYIRELVPESRIVFAHGQMPEKELEKKMKDFYDGKFNVLVCTTIIESGIDIPNANTMIVDRADRYGLSQLHQLRGRIGRSDKKAYAYFVVPKLQTLTPEAEKRLQALQTYADIGSGFHIASSDLEIRGAGDILGGDQSGHLEAVGLELYMELLKEAIHEIKGEKRIIKKDVEISTPFAAYIPHSYIEDSGMRLKTYKRLSNCENLEELDGLADELADVYGQLPQEVGHLMMILRVRLAVSAIGLKSIQVASKVIILNFEKSFLEANHELRNRIVEVFISRPKVYQFSPDFKVTYNHKTEVDLSFLLSFAKDIAQQIVPC